MLNNRILLLLAAVLLCPSNPARPADAVPAVHTIRSSISRVVVVRLKNGTDMLDGLRQAVAREKIRNAIIVSGMGSVTSYHVHAVKNSTLPPVDAFLKESGPYDLVAVNGMIVDGRVHAHISLAGTRKTAGGHLEPGSSVFTFAMITLAILDDSADLSRVDDWQWR